MVGKGLMSGIISISIALIVASAILPTAIVDITNTTLWEGAPAAVLTMVPVVGIVALVAILLALLRRK